LLAIYGNNVWCIFFENGLMNELTRQFSYIEIHAESKIFRDCKDFVGCHNQTIESSAETPASVAHKGIETVQHS
jgi:hypothetical protein